MRLTEAVLDVCVGVMAGYVATKVMETVSMILYQLEPEEDRRREDAVRPGPPYEMAARETARALGVELPAEQVKALGKVFHYGLGMSWGPVYTVLRSLSSVNPVAAGLLTGASLSLIVDEGLTPTLGFSAPNRAYPLVTHLRGFAAHLVFGLAVALGAEALGRVIPWRSQSANGTPLGRGQHRVPSRLQRPLDGLGVGLRRIVGDAHRLGVQVHLDLLHAHHPLGAGGDPWNTGASSHRRHVEAHGAQVTGPACRTPDGRLGGRAGSRTRCATGDHGDDGQG